MKKSYLVLTILFLFIGYLLNSVYRPYIYKNKIMDYGLADIGNNLIFVPGVYFLLLLVRNKPITNYFFDIILILSVYIGLEIFQIFNFFPGTFDYNDISGLLLGGITTALITNKLHNASNINNRFSAYNCKKKIN